MTAIQLQIPDGWYEAPHGAEFIALWKGKHGNRVPVPRAFQHRDGRTALVNREPFGNADDDWRWHISVRHGDPGVDGRVPTWEELVDTAHALRPGVCFVIGIPPRSWWMSVHPDVLHLTETKDQPLIETWRINARGDRPS
jgi:hypothetical protein